MKVIDDDDDDDDFDDDERKKSKKKTTLAQTIDQVMTIKTHTESSKTELSSGGKRPFKVWRFFFSKLIFSLRCIKTIVMPKKFNNFAKVGALVPIDPILSRLLFEGVPCNSHSRQYQSFYAFFFTWS